MTKSNTAAFHASKPESTRVMFRIDKRDKSIFAIFPDEEERRPGWVGMFDPQGGHTSGPYTGNIRISRPATPAEYAGIKRQLEKGYGYRIRVAYRK